MSLASAIRDAQDQRDAQSLFDELVAENERRLARGLPPFEPSLELAQKILHPTAAPRTSLLAAAAQGYYFCDRCQQIVHPRENAGEGAGAGPEPADNPAIRCPHCRRPTAAWHPPVLR